MRARGSGASGPAVSKGRPVLLSKKSSSLPGGIGLTELVWPRDTGRGSSEEWWLLDGEGHPGEVVSFLAVEDCSLN